MGIDFSHGKATWSYSGFMHFRTKLAAEIGCALYCMETFSWDYGASQPLSEVYVREAHSGDDINEKGRLIGVQPVIKWYNIDDAIVPLLNHSDCDGKLTIRECRKVAPRLRTLVEAWADDDYDKKMALRLADGMDEAVTNKKQFIFI